MADTNENGSAGTDDVVVEAETDEKERRPYIVVLMSQDMKDAVKAFADNGDTNSTDVCRRAIAAFIGYDLSSEPEPVRRKKYETPEEKEAAHKLASKKSGLLRKALFQAHAAQLAALKGNKKPALLETANAVTLDLDGDHTMESLEALNARLDAAIKAGK